MRLYFSHVAEMNEITDDDNNSGITVTTMLEKWSATVRRTIASLTAKAYGHDQCNETTVDKSLLLRFHFTFHFHSICPSAPFPSFPLRPTSFLSNFPFAAPFLLLLPSSFTPRIQLGDRDEIFQMATSSETRRQLPPRAQA